MAQLHLSVRLPRTAATATLPCPRSGLSWSVGSWKRPDYLHRCVDQGMIEGSSHSYQARPLLGSRRPVLGHVRRGARAIRRRGATSNVPPLAGGLIVDLTLSFPLGRFAAAAHLRIG
jgi:hypothetical protein